MRDLDEQFLERVSFRHDRGRNRAGVVASRRRLGLIQLPDELFELRIMDELGHRCYATGEPCRTSHLIPFFRVCSKK